ncbi:hypothetical protein [Bacillus badius]|uniref:Uncharacterized protein n=1 Tax=Bacillus badius TaxID=1455 RepID=A0ABR5APG7_BACBA|nr:hypothetical protein [Bacillus badius]KIL74232.1 hypothetical protein SD77_2887 [Bacillus badius]KZR57171.1 hypothetical protein A3781_20155 [Bacillus badius]MED4717285.1 hypothetical protein [Bacillus badius]
MKHKKDMKVVVHIGPEFEKRKEMMYDVIGDFLRKELEENPKLLEDYEEQKKILVTINPG